MSDFTCSALSDVYSLGASFLELVSGRHWFTRQGRGAMLEIGSSGYPAIRANPLFLPHVPTQWRNTINRLIRVDKTKRCASMAAAVDLISKLPSVANWTCEVTPDVIDWTQNGATRRKRVTWENYLRTGETWVAWTEDHAGENKRTLAKSDATDSWNLRYAKLREFFENAPATIA